MKLLTNKPLENSTVFLVGNTGAGKTTLAFNLLCQQERFVIFDIKGDFKTAFPSASSVEELAEKMNEGEARLVYTPQDFADCGDDLDNVLLFLFDFQKANAEKLGRLTFYLDEANRFADARKTPLPYLRELVQRGRELFHKIFSCQWFGQIPAWMRDSGSEYYIFGQQDEAGLRMLESRGFSREDLLGLPQYHCVHLDKKSGFRILRLVADNANNQGHESGKKEEQKSCELIAC